MAALDRGKTIQRQHIFGLDKRIVAEILEIAEQKTAGIADASVGIDKAREDDIRNADIFLIIDAGRPEPRYSAPYLLINWAGAMTLPMDLDILRPLAIHNIPVGQHGLVWRARSASEISSELWNQPGVDPSLQNTGLPESANWPWLPSTAAKLEPGSNHTSRISVSF